MVLLLYAANFVPLGRLHLNTLELVSAGALLMSAGGLFAMLLPVQIFHIHLREIRKGNSKWIRVSLVILLGVGVAFIARRTFVAAAQGVGEAFLERARTSLLDEEIPFYTYSLQWSILASVMFYAERRDWTTWAMATIALAGCIVGTGRTSLL
jgi:hypothetical protein